MRIREPFGPWIRGPGWKKFISGIRDKRPGSTLVTLRQPRSREVRYLVVEPHPRGEDPVDGLPRDPGPAPVLVLVVVVRVGGAQRLHLRLLPFAAHHKLYVFAASNKTFTSFFKDEKSHKTSFITVEIKVFLAIFARWWKDPDPDSYLLILETIIKPLLLSLSVICRYCIYHPGSPL